MFNQFISMSHLIRAGLFSKPEVVTRRAGWIRLICVVLSISSLTLADADVMFQGNETA